MDSPNNYGDDDEKVNVISGPATFIITDNNEIVQIVDGNKLKEEIHLLSISDYLPKNLNHSYGKNYASINATRTRKHGGHLVIKF